MQGWRQAEDEQGNGAIAQLLDRVTRAGVLPALPGLSGRVARITSGTASVDAMSSTITEDPALTFELLRLANAGTSSGSDEGPVLSPRRAIHLLGFNGVQRAAAGLRSWPGALSEDRALLLRRGVQAARRMAFAAAHLAPPGLHAEEPLVVALLRNLGRLLVLYHFPEEAVQIKALREGGMAEVPATCAVLGTDEESLALAVVRQWGWRDDALDTVRALDPEHLPHGQLKHLDWLRAMAGAIDETLLVVDRPPKDPRTGLPRVVQRYSRLIGTTGQELTEAVAVADQRLQAMVSGVNTARRPVTEPSAQPAAVNVAR